MTKRIIATLLAAAWFPLVFWLAGNDLTTKGSALAMCFVYASGLAVLVYTCPIWNGD